MKCSRGQSGFGGNLRQRAGAALIAILLTGCLIFISACAASGQQTRGERSGLAFGDKLLNRALVPLGKTANDLGPFVIMAGLLALAGGYWLRGSCLVAREVVFRMIG